MSRKLAKTAAAVGIAKPAGTNKPLHQPHGNLESDSESKRTPSAKPSRNRRAIHADSRTPTVKRLRLPVVDEASDLPLRTEMLHYNFGMSSPLRRVAVIVGLALTAVAGLALAAMGRKGRVPDDHTSLVRSPGVDPGKPSKSLSIVWLHHSTGDALLRGGLLDALKGDGVVFHDINYGEAGVDGYVVGDHTDVPDWPKTFNTPKFFNVVKTWKLPAGQKHHDVVMFKSCFPNSNITSDGMLDEYKRHFNDLLATIRANPDILFIGMSTPPLVKADTSLEAARRARSWAHWLTTEFARGVKNVGIFDLFDALAIAANRPDANTLVPQFSTGPKDSHPSSEGARAVTRLFIPWFNRLVREAGFSD
jgi:hypothetical protein